MPYVICSSCKATAHWRNQRGASISSARCSCGGKFRAAKWEDGKIVPREGGGVKGGLITCRLCGLRRKERGNSVKRRDHEATFEVRPSFAESLGGAGAIRVTVPAGEPVCWHHEETFPVWPRNDEHYRALAAAQEKAA